MVPGFFAVALHSRRRPEKGMAVAEVKITKKDLQEARRPDAVLEGASSLFDWLLERKNIILGAVIGVCVLIGIVSAVQSSSESKSEAVGSKLSSAIELTERQVTAPGATDKDKTKKDQFATKEEKAKAVSEAFDNFAKDNAGSTAGNTAALKLAELRLHDGKFDEAAGFAEKAAANKDLDMFAYESLGYAYEGKGDTAKATEAFKKMADAGAPALALYHQARLTEKAGNKEEARKLYEKVVADFDKDSISGDAKARLDLLNLPPPGVGAIEPPPAAPEAPAKAPKKGAKPAAPKPAPAIK